MPPLARWCGISGATTSKYHPALPSLLTVTGTSFPSSGGLRDIPGQSHPDILASSSARRRESRRERRRTAQQAKLECCASTARRYFKVRGDEESVYILLFRRDSGSLGADHVSTPANLSGSSELPCSGKPGSWSGTSPNKVSRPGVVQKSLDFRAAGHHLRVLRRPGWLRHQALAAPRNPPIGEVALSHRWPFLAKTASAPAPL